MGGHFERAVQILTVLAWTPESGKTQVYSQQASTLPTAASAGRHPCYSAASAGPQACAVEHGLPACILDISKET